MWYHCFINMVLEEAELIKWIMAPLMGAIIGYITNDLAIRMLFHPRKPIYIGKFHVPFTPGLIPSQKGRIAQSVGRVISEQLLNEDTLRQTILSEKALSGLQARVREAVQGLARDERTVDEVLQGRFDADAIQKKAEAAQLSLTIAACEKLDEARVGQIVVDSLTGPMMDGISQNKLLAKLVDAKTQTALKSMMAGKVDEIVAEKAPEVIYRVLNETVTNLRQKRVCDLYARYSDKEDALIQQATDLYVTLLGENLDKVLKAVNIEKIVVDKINGFDAAQLEDMIFGIMKKELNAIVYLGAGLGFLMGFVNALF